jgi:hypothetical protein
MDRAFPGRTPADLYVWITWHKDREEQRERGCREPEDAAEIYRKKFGGGPGLLGRLIARFRK